jgi:hypothetical protein
MVRINNRLTFLFIEMLDKGLKSEDDVLRTKVLIEINEDFHQADKLNFALESPILN